ncbi:biopolymer transporter ExbD [Pusillimonas caeni]|uniref:ExbD/TolR family protein n=1 Tax=Pusillimonas caeni TaxID=1348472 RepID=UPI000E59DAC5|nr:biopolymer transporter ExbD [Pusillimonas caeni]TFL11435.1 biopolymer transporter ExbD [Pusillimonas caeni]
MNFRRRSWDDEPDINLIPLIDVLLVILIFLAASTSFNRMQQFEVTLPEARAQEADPQALNIAVSRDGLYALDGRLIGDGRTADIADALRQARRSPEQALVINADAQSPHESVMRVLEAAQQAGLGRIHFAVQSPP